MLDDILFFLLFMTPIALLHVAFHVWLWRNSRRLERWRRRLMLKLGMPPESYERREWSQGDIDEVKR